MILLVIGMIPAIVAGYYILKLDIVPVYIRKIFWYDIAYGALTMAIVLVIMILCGIYFPARVAMNINPAEALKDQ